MKSIIKCRSILLSVLSQHSNKRELKVNGKCLVSKGKDETSAVGGG